MRPVQARERTDVAAGGKGYVLSVLRPGWRHFRVLARCQDPAARVAHLHHWIEKGLLGLEWRRALRRSNHFPWDAIIRLETGAIIPRRAGARNQEPVPEA